MNDSAAALLQKHGRAALFLDTSILLLLVVGSCDRQLISRFTHTMKYTAEDYDLAVCFVELFTRVVTTPSVLAEVSNLASQLDPTVRARGFEVFARYIHLLDERQVESANLALTDEFRRFGLTAASILQVARGTCIVLTDDLRLVHYMEEQCLPVLNFTHLRAPNLLG